MADYESGTLYTGTSSHSAVNIRLKYSYTQDYSTKTTHIFVTMQNARYSTAWASRNTNANKYIQQDNVTKVSGRGFDVSGYTANVWYDIMSSSWDIVHNDDGTKSITLKGVLETGVTPGTLTCSQSITLHQIPVSVDMNIRLGDNVIKKAYVGTTEVKEVFYGDINIFPGYTRLEYIQSSGSQYIRTGVNDSNDSAICCKFYTANPNDNYMFGSRQNGSLMLYNGLYSNNQLEYNWQTITYTANNTIEMTQTIVGTTNTIKINSQTFTKSTGSVSAYEIFIFACNNSSVRYYTGTTRCYYFKMYRGSTLVRDFIPVKRKTDNKVGLYDLVEHKFYGNSGSGDFVAGPEV